MLQSSRGGNGLPIGSTGVSWEEQGRQSVSACSDTRFKSPALGLEVKLLEALSRGRKPGEDDEDRTPTNLRAAVCLELLGELEEMFGPFRGVIRTLRHELANCVYSNYFLSQDGSATFDQVPYFTVADRLSSEKETLLLERSRFVRQLKQRNEDVVAIETKLNVLELRLRGSEEAREHLQSELDAAVKRLEAQGDVERTAKEETIRMKKDLLRTKEELQRIRLNTAGIAAQGAIDMAAVERLQRTANSSQRELMKAQAEIERLVNELALERDRNAHRPAIEDFRDALNQVAVLEMELARVNRQKADGSMTPRPEWDRLGLSGPSGRASTSEAAAASSKHLAEALADALERAKGEITMARADRNDLEARLEKLQAFNARLMQEADKSAGPTGGATPSRKPGTATLGATPVKK